MALVNYATREISAKIVYYGPALSGKTTNIHHVYNKVKPKNKGKLISLSTQGDRTLFFDFLPMELGQIKGFKTRFHLYTVPGQVFYNSTRKLVLKGADGVVFVADSQKMMMDENIQSIENLKANLRDMGLRFEDFPVVMQYNKRDLPNAAAVDEMEEFLNPYGFPCFEASALSGEGVLVSLTAVVKMILHNLKQDPEGQLVDLALQEEVAPPAHEAEVKVKVTGAEPIMSTAGPEPEPEPMRPVQAAEPEPEPMQPVQEAEAPDIVAPVETDGMPDTAPVTEEPEHAVEEEQEPVYEVRMEPVSEPAAEPVSEPGITDPAPVGAVSSGHTLDLDEIPEFPDVTAPDDGVNFVLADTPDDHEKVAAEADGPELLKYGSIHEELMARGPEPFDAEDEPPAETFTLPPQSIKITELDLSWEDEVRMDEVLNGHVPGFEKPAAPDVFQPPVPLPRPETSPAHISKQTFILPLRISMIDGVKEVKLKVNVDIEMTGDVDFVNKIDLNLPMPKEPFAPVRPPSINEAKPARPPEGWTKQPVMPMPKPEVKDAKLTLLQKILGLNKDK